MLSVDAGYFPSTDPGAAIIDVGGMRSHWMTQLRCRMLSLTGANLSCQRCRGRTLSWPAAEQLERIRTRATDIDSCVKSKVDRSFIDAKEFDMKRAVGKLSFSCMWICNRVVLADK